MTGRPSRRRPRRRLPKPVGIAVVSLIGLVLLSSVALVAFRLLREGSLPGIEVAGVDVGALLEGDLDDSLRAIESERDRDRIVFTRPAAGAAPAATVVTTAGDLGYAIDADLTSERILERGRQSNPVAALFDQLRATFGTIEVDPVDSFIVDAHDSPIAEVARTLASPPSYGSVAFTGGGVEPRYPEPGVVVSEDEVRSEALTAARAPGGNQVEVRGTPVDPPTDEADVDALMAEARRAVDGPVSLTRGDRFLRFTPKELAAAIATRRSGDDLSLHIPVRAIAGRLKEDGSDLETPPVDATFELSGSSVSVVPHRPGFRLVPTATADQLLEVALRRGASKARLEGETSAADFTTKEARALDITEQVSTFTTYHSCCEPRVENIHRIADIVDGAIVQPGESFSLNDYVGPRTTVNGFVAAPAIRDGEFVEEVGGGISQFATTIFNAIFFGGYDLLEYQPHSYYISRYPPGREATISTPAPDLAFLNDSNAGVYIDTSYTEESITVSFYGNQDFDVHAREGPRKKVTPPKTKCRVDESLAKGEENVVQEGLTGFDIVVTRVFSDGRPDEHFSTHYDMQPRIVERRTCEKKKR